MSGISDMTLSVVNTRLHDASEHDFAATELYSRYIVKHIGTEQLQRYREFGRVLGYAMVNKGSASFNAALPLWKYLTNRPITTTDLYFMYPTFYDVSTEGHCFAHKVNLICTCCRTCSEYCPYNMHSSMIWPKYSSGGSCLTK